MSGKKIVERWLPEIAFILGIILLVSGVFLYWNPALDHKPSGVNRYSQIQKSKDQGVSRFNLSYQHLHNKSAEITVIIPVGSSGLAISQLLEDKGLVKADDFQKLLQLFDFERKIRAGRYVFKNDDTIADILATIILRR